MNEGASCIAHFGIEYGKIHLHIFISMSCSFHRCRMITIYNIFYDANVFFYLQQFCTRRHYRHTHVKEHVSSMLGCVECIIMNVQIICECHIRMPTSLSFMPSCCPPVSWCYYLYTCYDTTNSLKPIGWRLYLAIRAYEVVPLDWKFLIYFLSTRRCRLCFKHMVMYVCVYYYMYKKANGTLIDNYEYISHYVKIKHAIY